MLTYTGNLMVSVKVKEHETYTPNEHDLFQDLKINVFDVITGCDVEANITVVRVLEQK